MAIDDTCKHLTYAQIARKTDVFFALAVIFSSDCFKRVLFLPFGRRCASFALLAARL
jgi:hypothetical protein